jgi:hypothetical protein
MLIIMPINLQEYIIAMVIEFAQLSSAETQTPTDSSPVKVSFDQKDEIYEIIHDPAKPEDILIKHPGVYVIIAAPQIGRTSGTTSRHVDVWLNRNGRNIPNSNVRKVLVMGEGETDVIVSQNMTTLEAGDVINVMMSVETGHEGLGIHTIKPKDEREPLIPSIILSMHKIQDHSTYFYRKGNTP